MIGWMISFFLGSVTTALLFLAVYGIGRAVGPRNSKDDHY